MPMNRRTFALTQLLVLGSTAVPRAWAADASADLERRFTQTVRPFLASYCVGCHSGASPAGQFDLRASSSVAAVVRDFSHWNLMIDKLSAGQMPPKVAPQPPAQAKQAVIEWVQAVRANEARRNA